MISNSRKYYLFNLQYNGSVLLQENSFGLHWPILLKKLELEAPQLPIIRFLAQDRFLIMNFLK